MNIGKLLGKVARAAKENPEIALAVAGLFAPKLVAKGVKVATKVKVAREVVKGL